MRIPTEQEIYDALCARHGKEVQDMLNSSRVVIAGLGGLGSNIAVSLGRIGVGHLRLIDFDRVDISNLNRQQYQIADLGRDKTEALKEMLLGINPYLDVETCPVKVTPENAAGLMADADVICEAFDRAEEKAMLVDAFFEYCGSEPERTTHLKLLSGSGMAGYGSSNRIRTEKITEQFYLCGDRDSGIETGMCLMAPRVSICAGHEANMVVRLLLGEYDT